MPWVTGAVVHAKPLGTLAAGPPAHLRPRLGAGLLALVLVESVAVASLVAATAPAVLGVDCTGNAVPNNGREYALAQQPDIGNPAIGIQGTIQHTNPNVCTHPGGFAFSLAVVTLAPTTTATGWVQPGWRKDEGDAEPSWVCEYHSTSDQNFIYQGPISNFEHIYKISYDSFDQLWDCFVDNVNVVSKGNIGFTSGDFVNSQGESNVRYGQIGRVDPGRLLIHNVNYLRGGSWKAAVFVDYVHTECQFIGTPNQVCFIDTHYGVDQDGNFDSNLRIWTW
jgi:hypothetical protein